MLAESGGLVGWQISGGAVERKKKLVNATNTFGGGPRTTGLII